MPNNYRRARTSKIEATGVTFLATALILWIVAIATALILVATAALDVTAWSSVAYALFPAAGALLFLVVSLLLAGVDVIRK